MTNEEAIEIIKIAIAEVEWNYPMDYAIAFDVAINALKKEIPKNHFKNLYELPEDVAADAMKLAKRMAIRMTEKLGADGFNLVQNNEEVAGQSVFHFHMHLIPRYENDGAHILWKPTETSQEELEEIKNRIVND